MEHRTDIAAPSPDEIRRAARVLAALARDRGLLAEVEPEVRHELLHHAGRLAHPERTASVRLHKALRRKDRREQRRHDAEIVHRTGMRVATAAPVFVAPSPLPPPPGAELAGELQQARSCYVCKHEYRQVHFFYDSMCPPCARLNYAKRSQTASLDGRVALITGARLKIGYHAALMMLRAGATVVSTTRFPVDAAQRYAREPDFAAWAHRLKIHGLDLRHAPSVELFTRHLDATLPRLDIVINNAAQTVRRPPAFYAHLVAGEERPLGELPATVRPLLSDRAEALARAPGIPSPARLSQIATLPDDDLATAWMFPAGATDADRQQIDLRPMNSWRLAASDVPTPELLEVHLVNAIAPFILTSRLKPLMSRDRTDEKHVVNVSAMEAQFSRRKKTDKHPHTNMAKAALNMFTRTSAVDYAASGIWMNSVDTGWVTDEDPLHHVARKQRDHAFWPPLDIVDGAARILDPIFTGLLTGKHPFGMFFKDYRPTTW